MGLSQQDVDHIFHNLRSGVVPERGLDAFAVGIERQRNEIGRLLDLTAQGEGVFKFLRGGYGCGKSFSARLAVLDAQARGFATSFVVVSDNDLHFHKFDDVYRKVLQNLGTQSCPNGALADIVDRWIAKVEDNLIATGADDSAPDFDEKVEKRLGEELQSLTRQAAPEDFVRAVRAIFSLKQAGNIADAGALLSWLSGSSNVSTSSKKTAGIKGDIESQDAMAYLRGVLELVKAAGYKGLLIIIDEAETILRMRSDVRGKSLNGIRQICDDANRNHGLMWLFTGTPEFFDVKRGVAGLQPLHDRIKFESMGGYVSVRQPQLELKPFDGPRLQEVALKLREIYLSKDRARLLRLISPELIQRLVDDVTKGFGGDVGVVPRQFLRKFANLLDLVEQESDFDPVAALGFKPEQLTPAEERIIKKQPPFDPEPDDDQGYATAAVAF